MLQLQQFLNTLTTLSSVIIDRLLDNYTFDAIFNVLKDNTTILALEIGNLNIDFNRCLAIINMLDKNITLTTFNLSRNSVENSAWLILAPVLNQNKRITTLILTYNTFTDINYTSCNILKDNNVITSFDMSGSYMGYDGCIIIASILKDNKKLKTLILKNNDIFPDGYFLINEALKTNTTLISLNISSNFIGTIYDVLSLADMLKINITLKELDISHNILSSNTTKAIFKVLQENTTLKSLNISHNCIDNNSIPELLTMLNKNTTLTKLNISNRIFTDYTLTGKSPFIDMVKENSTLISINIGGNYINRENMQIIYKKVGQNLKLLKEQITNQEKVINQQKEEHFNMLMYLSITECKEISKHIIYTYSQFLLSLRQVEIAKLVELKDRL